MNHEKLPFVSGEQQVQGLPPCKELEEVTANFHKNVLITLSNAGVPIILSESRTKGKARIEQKVDKDPKWPLVDIHGARVVLEDEHIDNAVQALQRKWPTPRNLFWGPSSIQYPIFATSTKFDQPERLIYEATHMRVHIPDGARIAEIQLQTPEQHLIAELARPYFEQSR